MSIRRVTRTVVKSLAATAITGTALVMFSGVSGAAATQYPNSVVPQAPFNAGTPFSSGQMVNVVIPANSILTPNANAVILECADPGGTVANLPTDASACDGGTTNGPTETVNPDGSVNFQTDTGSLYQLLALPDLTTLGEQANHLPVCNTTNPCVLYIGQNITDFTAPHVFTQSFLITPNGVDTGTNPGDGLPEVPYAIVLPLAAMGVLGGAVAIRRRRSAKADVKTAA
jgi:MYXO-CTERM domain-containing protein